MLNFDMVYLLNMVETKTKKTVELLIGLFVCRMCTGLGEPAYQLLTAEVYAEWVCDKCLNSKNIPLVKFKP